MTKYEWDKPRDEYIYGVRDKHGDKHFPSQREVCEKYNIPKSTLSSRASDENWSEQREKAREKVDQKVMEKRTERDAEDIVKSDQTFELQGENVSKIIARKIDANWKLMDKGKYVSGYEILNLAKALATAQTVVKIAQGDMIERRKLELSGVVGTSLFDDIDELETEVNKKERKLEDVLEKELNKKSKEEIKD